jgi:hypothetical protein
MDKHMAEPLVSEPSLVEGWKLLLQNWKGINPQVLITFWSNWLKQEVKHYVLRYTNLVVSLGIRRTCHRSGRSLLFYQFIKRVVRQTNNFWGISLISTANKIYPTFFWPG